MIKKYQHASVYRFRWVAVFLLLVTSTVKASDALDVLDISERAYDGGNAIAITFNKAIDSSQDIDRYLNLDRDGGYVDGSWILSDSLKVAYFTHAEPETRYNVSAFRGLRAIDGSLLKQARQKEITTRKIVPSVTFIGNEIFMPTSLSDGLSVEATNVSEVNIEFFHVRDSQIPKFLDFMSNRHRGGWYSYYLKKLTQYGELVYSGRFELPSEPNKRRVHNIAVSDLPALEATGVYFAVMSRPGVYSDYLQVTYFSKTDIGLHSRVYASSIDVYASSIATGEALDDVDVSLINENGSVLKQGITDKNGFVRFNVSASVASVIRARSDSHFSFISLKGPALDLSQFDIGERQQRQEEIFIYSPRDLYRPGETVVLSALRRDHDGRLIRPIPLQVKILRPDRAIAANFTWYPGKAGYYGYEYQLPESATTGNWKVQVSGVDQTPVEYDLKVEDFLPERMEIEFNKGLLTPIVVDEKESLDIAVTGRYLHGAPASGNRMSALVNARKAKDPVKTLKGYQFGHQNKKKPSPFNIPEIRLDENGNGVLRVGPEWQHSQAALDVQFVTSLYESGGRPVSRTYSAYIWPEQEMIGISPDFGKENPPQNSRVGFKIVKSNFNGEVFAANNLQARLIREDRQYFWEFQNNSGWRWNWTESEYPVYSEEFDLQADQPAQLKIPVEYGRYRLEVFDESNNNQLSSVRFHAGEDWYYWWRQNNSERASPRPDQVNLALDAESYRPGDVAQLRVVSPHAGQAIVTVESDRLLWTARHDVAKGGSTINIPIGLNWTSHDIYITAVVLKPGDSQNIVSPNRAIGITHLALDRTDRELVVEIQTADKLLPDKTHPINIKVSGGNQTGQKYVTLAAVDVGVLAISDFETPNPHAGFFDQRRYNVDQRDMYNNIMELRRSRKALLKFGGDAMLAKGGEQARAEVQIVALFNGPVTLDGNGETSINLKLPEFNGRLRLMAIAFDDDSFGSSEKDITVASPVIAELSMPRFMAFGDEAELALDVTNLSGATEIFRIEIETSRPLKMKEDFIKVVTLENSERHIARFTIDALQQAGKGEIKVKVSGEKIETIERNWKLAVRSAYPAVTRTTSQLLTPGDSLALANALDMDDYRQESLQALLSVSTEANLRIRENLDKLIRYPYGCLEQTTSAAYPLAFATSGNLRSVGINQFSEQDIQHRIDKATKRLSSLQKSNGSFGLWNGNSSEQTWLTSYVADYLLVAQQNGFVISKDMLSSTLKRLEYYVQRGDNISRSRYSYSPEHYSVATKSYAGYLLASLNRVPLGRLRSLYNKEANNAKSPLPLVHLSLALKLQGDHKLAKQAFDKAMELPTKRRRYYLGDYGSHIRDLGMMIHLLLKHDFETVKARELAFILEKEIRAKRWLSTQERNALFLAGVSLQSLPSQQWSAELYVGEEVIALGHDGDSSRLFKSKEIGERFMFIAGEGANTYTSLSVSGYLKQPPVAESSGMRIEKNYYDSKGAPIDLDDVKSGDVVLVDLLVWAEQRTPDALVVDLLPAGFELENQNLKHSVSLDNFSIQGESIEALQKNVDLKHQEFRDDRYIAAVDINYPREIHIIYPNASCNHWPFFSAIGIRGGYVST